MYERNLPVRVGRESPRDLRLVRWALESKLCLRVRPEGSKGAGFPYPAIGQSLAEGSPDTPTPRHFRVRKQSGSRGQGQFLEAVSQVQGAGSKSTPKGVGVVP